VAQREPIVSLTREEVRALLALIQSNGSRDPEIAKSVCDKLRNALAASGLKASDVDNDSNGP